MTNESGRDIPPQVQMENIDASVQSESLVRTESDLLLPLSAEHKNALRSAIDFGFTTKFSALLVDLESVCKAQNSPNKEFVAIGKEAASSAVALYGEILTRIRSGIELLQDYQEYEGVDKLIANQTNLLLSLEKLGLFDEEAARDLSVNYVGGNLDGIIDDILAEAKQFETLGLFTRKRPDNK